MALDPSIVFRGTIPQIPDVGARLARGAQAQGIFQNMRNEAAMAPVRQQIAETEAALNNIKLAEAEAQRVEDTKQRDTTNIARNYLINERNIKAGNYGEVVKNLESYVDRERAAGQTDDELSDTLNAIEVFKSNDPNAITSLINTAKGAVDYAKGRGWIGGATGKRSALQRGTGALEGYVFNPDTGLYSIDPTIKDVLSKKALQAQAEGKQIDLKTKQSINKDLTGILKDTVKIRRSAEELDQLEELKTPAAKLGAVFKFMKSLDPTSVVRETEQGQVYAASGAAAQLAGSINSLLGEGKLTDQGFRDLVRTAKSIANANIESVGGEVGTLLESFGESITQGF